ncbi:hypothetical protein [Paraburkholderia fynbosensis]|uniref:Uncharacterized protein n=1 Tax=Paraburkholderia fynbosensis TaxID=1200993 RepID=A0A6J5FIA9_9BURK|nr:hypothetical protein [Paraburkholderia fynbosensis]CAB3780917.1 hypothetical protein LMG27177_01025 [Paraburkholderia fynbosensis]
MDLLLSKKLKDVKKLCRDKTINVSDFVNIVVACDAGILPWLHQISHRDFLPPHLDLTEDDRRAIATNGVGRLNPVALKAFGKITQTFEERRFLVGHMFYLPDHTRWTFFYFDQRDTNVAENHFKGGAHVHAQSHLMPGRTPTEVWREFHEGNPDMKGSYHVRWDDPKRRRGSAPTPGL